MANKSIIFVCCMRPSKGEIRIQVLLVLGTETLGSSAVCLSLNLSGDPSFLRGNESEELNCSAWVKQAHSINNVNSAARFGLCCGYT